MLSSIGSSTSKCGEYSRLQLYFHYLTIFFCRCYFLTNSSTSLSKTVKIFFFWATFKSCRRNLIDLISSNELHVPGRKANLVKYSIPLLSSSGISFNADSFLGASPWSSFPQMQRCNVYRYCISIFIGKDELHSLVLQVHIFTMRTRCVTSAESNHINPSQRVSNVRRKSI